MTRFRAIAIGLVLLLLISLAGAWLARVQIASSIAKSYLSSLGLGATEFEIQELSLQRLYISNVAIEPEIHVQDLNLHYTVSGLLSGELDKVEIDKVDLDISQPDQGNLKLLQDAIRTISEDTGEASQNPLKLPYVVLTELSWKRHDDISDLTGRVDGEILSDGETQFQMSVRGGASTGGYQILLDGADIQVSGNLLKETFKISSDSVLVKSGADEGQIPTMTLSFAGASDLKVVSGDVLATLEDGSPLLDVKFHHDLTQENGNALIKMAEIEIGEGVIRPDLILSTFNVPPVKGRVAANITANWDNKAIAAGGEITGQEIEVDLGHQAVSLGALELISSSSATLGEDLPLPKLELRALNVRLVSGDDLINSPRIMASIRGDLKNIIGQMSGEFDGRVSGQDIPTSEFKLSVSGKPEELSVRGDISSFAGSLQPVISANVNALEKEGDFTLLFPKTDIGPKAVDVSKWIDQSLSGVVEAKITGRFQGNSYVIQKAALNGENLEMALDEGVRARLSFNAAAENVKPDHPFKITLQNIEGLAAQNNRIFRFNGGSATVDVAEDWGRGGFALQPIVFSPNSKNDWKTPVTFSGDGTFDRDAVAFSGEAKTPLTGRLLELSGRHNLIANKGKVDFKLLTLPFTSEGLQPSDFWRKSFDDLDLSGDIAAVGTVSWGRGAPNGTATIELSDLTAFQEGLFFEGLDGKLKIDSLNPIIISEAQTVSVDRMFVGVPLGKSEITFRLKQTEAAPMLLLDRVLIEMFQGAAEIKDGVIDLASEQNTLEMKLYRLSLKELMALGEFEDVNATGALSGVIPLNFNGETLFIDEAVLAAEEPGVLQITSEQARQALSSGGSQTKLLFDILENFKYSNLSLRINKPETGEDVITLHAEGGNPNVENNRPVILNVNLSTNFDKIFNTVLEGYRLSEKALRATVRNRNN